MSCKMMETGTTLHSSLNSSDCRDSLSSISLSNQIKLLTDSIDEVQDKIQYLKLNLDKMSQKQLEQELGRFPDLQTVSSKITELFLIQQTQKSSGTFIYEIPTELEVVEETCSPSLYEIPVELIPLQTQNQVYQVPVEIQFMIHEDQVASYLSEFQSIQTLPEKIKNIIQQYDSNQKQIYQIPIEMNIDTVQKKYPPIDASTQLLHNLSEYEIESESYSQDWNFVDDTLDRMKKIIKDFSTQNIDMEPSSSVIQKDFDELNMTGNISEDLKLINQQGLSSTEKNLMLYEVPIEMKPLSQAQDKEYTSVEIQCQQNDKVKLFEIPVQMEAYSPECQLTSNLIDVKIKPFKKKDLYFCSSPQKADKNRSHLVTSISNSSSSDIISSSNIRIQQIDTINEPFQQGQPLTKTAIPESLTYRHNPIYLIASESSSEGSNTDRDIYLGQINDKTNLKLDIHENSPNDQEINVEMTEYYDLKEKIYSLEEEKNQLLDQLRFSQQQIKTLKDEILVQKESIYFLKNQSKEDDHDYKMNRLQDSGKKKTQKIQKLQSQNESLKKAIEEYKLQLEDKNDQLAKMEKNFQSLESQFFTELEKLHHELNEKQFQMTQVQKQIEESSRYHKNEIGEFIKVNQDLRTCIDDLTKEVDEKKLTIEEFKYDYDRLMSQMQAACSEKNELSDVKTLYSKEYEKMKENYDYETMKKDQQIKDLHYEIKRLETELTETREYSENAKQAIDQYQLVIDDLRQKLQNKGKEVKNSKLAIASHVEAQLDYLRRQLVSLTKEVQIKDLKIKQISLELEQRPSKSSTMEIESCQDEKIDHQILYIKELKEIIGQYEKILLENQQTIKQLQAYVYQYLGDALEKEQEAQNLYENLLNFESELNEAVLQKINLERENKKLKRIMAMSERKVAFGSKFAGEKVQDDSYVKEKVSQIKLKHTKSQNSTIKMGGQTNMIH